VRSRRRRYFSPLLGLVSSVVFICHLLPDTGLREPSMAAAAATETLSGLTFPAHAIPRPGGRGWECIRGYWREGNRCVQVHVPPHAFLDYFGHDWECERSYRREGDRCVTVHVPSHAFLDYSGHDWECERSYRREGGRCVTVHVPSHAFLDYSGHDWECERGYRREGGRCVTVHVPPYAFLDITGHDWGCERGYRQEGGRCVPVHPDQVSRARSAATSVEGTFSDEVLTRLATEVYANREGPHDQQTIARLQRQLHQVGYDPGPIDGLLGPRTLETLRRFLMDRGLGSGTVSHTTTSPVPDS
jgi:hypothetical protein